MSFVRQLSSAARLPCTCTPFLGRASIAPFPPAMIRTNRPSTSAALFSTTSPASADYRDSRNKPDYRDGPPRRKPFARRPRSQLGEPEPPKPLSRIDPTSPSALEQLTSEETSALRLLTMNQLGRVPSADDLRTHLPIFIRREAARGKAAIKEAERVLRSKTETQHKLDLAYEWARKAEEEAGLYRSEEKLRQDDFVRQRLERHRIEKDALRAEQAGKAPLPGSIAEERLRRAGLVGPPSSPPWSLPPNAPAWRVQKEALRDKFPEGWAPPKRLSREAMDLIRVLVKEQPDVYTTPVLAERFKVSPEAIRRIVRSRFSLPPGERERREERRKLQRQEKIAEDAENGGEGHVWAGDWLSERFEMDKLRSGRERDAVEAKVRDADGRYRRD